MPSIRAIERKKGKVQELGNIFNCNGVYLFDYRGMTVMEMEDLRRKVKELNAQIKVIKNRLAIKYFEGEQKDFGRDLFNGPLAVVYGDDNCTELAKMMVNYEKDSNKIKIRYGFIERNFSNVDQIKLVAKLPGREQLMAQFALTMVMPLKKMAMAFSGPLRSILILMQNLKDKKEKEANNG